MRRWFLLLFVLGCAHRVPGPDFVNVEQDSNKVCYTAKCSSGTSGVFFSSHKQFDCWCWEPCGAQGSYARCWNSAPACESDAL